MVKRDCNETHSLADGDYGGQCFPLPALLTDGDYGGQCFPLSALLTDGHYGG